MTSCEEFEELLSALIDGELTPEEHEKIDEHITKCKACASLLKLYKAMSKELSAVPKPPEDFRKRVMDRIASLPGEPGKKRGKLIFIKPWMTTVAAAVCLALILLVSPLRGALQPKKETEESAQLMLAAAPSAFPQEAEGVGTCDVVEDGDESNVWFSASEATDDSASPDEPVSGKTDSAPPAAGMEKEAQARGNDVIGGIQTAERPTMQGILGYAPPGVSSMPEPTMEMAEAAVYYAVITVHGEMPEELTDIEFMAQPDGYETAEIPVETARALIDAGFEVVYGGEECRKALVVYYP
ncbi:MAG TPA: hypothetical protein GXZ77_03460 [Papillibacter sp.]|jgi:negative regulator of sigma E activity|nr:hypothetical protein [Papillibacter sp.]